MHWENSEVDTLRISFLQGMSLKGIARVLDKSPGAINKALTRFNIRPPRKPKPVWSIAALDVAPKPKRNRVKRDVLVSLRETSAWQSSKTIYMTSDKHWVHLEEVVAFLLQSGEQLTVVGHGAHATYYLNKRLMSPADLLIKANQYRSEKRLPPFYVESLTVY